MFWVIPIIAGLVSGGGGSAGVNYLWGEEPTHPVMEYRMDHLEGQYIALKNEAEKLKTRVNKLPPPYWQDKIGDMDARLRELSAAMIRLERHGHPEVDYQRRGSLEESQPKRSNP